MPPQAPLRREQLTFPHRLWTYRNRQLDSYPAGAALGWVEASGGPGIGGQWAWGQ